MRRHPRSLAQCQVTGQTALPADHDEIVELGAARDANLRDDHATPANDDVVPDLHQIINHRAVAITVFGSAPRSIVVLALISTSSPMTTRPIRAPGRMRT